MSAQKSAQKSAPDREDAKKQSLFAAYNNLMVRYPITMNLVLSALISVLSSVANQYLTISRGGATSIDWTPVWKMAVIISTLVTPSILAFYSVLNTKVNGTIPKLIVDQLLFAPVLTGVFLAYHSVFVGGMALDLAVLAPHVLNILPGIMTKSWLFWVPTRFVAIYLLPPAHHNIFGNVMSFIWNMILLASME